MPRSKLQLRREIYRGDVYRIIDWLQDEKVSAHLNEEQNIAAELERLVRTSPMPIFTASFNRGGTMFMITLPDRGPIGFLRLASSGESAEIVIVIGERSEWGKGYGYSAILKGIRHAFSEWRKRRIHAKIRKENRRSKAVFRKAGFRKVEEMEREEHFVLPLEKAFKQ